jgi:hypothetical protein
VKTCPQCKRPTLRLDPMVRICSTCLRRNRREAFFHDLISGRAPIGYGIGLTVLLLVGLAILLVFVRSLLVGG